MPDSWRQRSPPKGNDQPNVAARLGPQDFSASSPLDRDRQHNGGAILLAGAETIARTFNPAGVERTVTDSCDNARWPYLSIPTQAHLSERREHALGLTESLAGRVRDRAAGCLGSCG